MRGVVAFVVMIKGLDGWWGDDEDGEEGAKHEDVLIGEMIIERIKRWWIKEDMMEKAACSSLATSGGGGLLSWGGWWLLGLVNRVFFFLSSFSLKTSRSFPTLETLA